MKITKLLDGKTDVSSEELVLKMLKSAFLTLEAKGNIEFENIDNGEDKKEKSLIVKPLDVDVAFPSKTLEYRLYPKRTNTVKAIVTQWIIDDSIDPWSRAVEQGKIMLVLRGLASISNTNGRKYNHSKLGLEKKETESPKLEQVKNLLKDCKENRPEIWKLLDQEIRSAIGSKTLSSDKGEKRREKDLWENESQEDQDLYFQS